MSEPPAAGTFETMVAEAPTVAAPTKKAAASLELLGGDEIIQLSIRPSPWCIPVYSLKLVAAMVLLAAAIVIAGQGRSSFGVSIGLLVVVLVTFTSVVAATLQWASRLYVLTNRRVMRFQGVFSVGVVECGLSQIAETYLQRTWYHPLLHLGSLGMQPSGNDKPAIFWEHIARPDEVHEIVEQAIHKARSR